MKVIALVSRKGGAGKTTLAAHLAVEAERQGVGPVVLVDTDPQGSLSAWWEVREGDSPALGTVSLSSLKADLGALEAAGASLVLVDTPPALTDEIRAVVAVADLVLIPTRPSPNDLRAIAGTVDLVEAAGKRMVFVVNSAANRSRLAADAAIVLSQHGTVAPVMVGQRTDFAASMIDGRTAGELDPKSRSAGEVSDLWAYVAHQLTKSAKP